MIHKSVIRDKPCNSTMELGTWQIRIGASGSDIQHRGRLPRPPAVTIVDTRAQINVHIKKSIATRWHSSPSRHGNFGVIHRGCVNVYPPSNDQQVQPTQRAGTEACPYTVSENTHCPNLNGIHINYLTVIHSLAVSKGRQRQDDFI